MLTITLPDKTQKKFPGPLTVKEAIKSISPSLAKKALVAKINSELVPLHCLIKQNATMEVFTIQDGLSTKLIQYTAGLILAAALKKFNSKIIVADVIADFNSFQVSFLAEETVKEKDLAVLNKYVWQILKQNQIKFHKEQFSATKHLSANRFLADLQSSIKFANVASDIAVEAMFVAVPFKYVKNFEIISMAGAYWQENKNNVMLQRIHGIATYDKSFFDQVKADHENSLKYDHRKLGKEQNIFILSPEVGQGLPIWTPKGTLIYKNIRQLVQDKEWEYGFEEVFTPILAPKELYEVSGHLQHYEDDMFPPICKGGEDFYLRPMACPHHIMLYKLTHPHSYRELPIRFSEAALLHRYEASGGLSGLERVRAMTLTDAHIFVTPQDLKAEFKRCFQLMNEVLAIFKVDISYLSLSTRDPNSSDKYYKDDEMWQKSEQVLQEALDELKVEYKVKPGEAAFYGPKMDVQINNVLGREITISTLQLDFLMPRKFDISFIDKDNQKQYPIIIHRGLIGTYERFISILLEQYRGEWPLWLAPLQIMIIPVSREYHLDYCRFLYSKLREHKFKVAVDDRDERLSYKVRDAQINKIPIQITIGDQEIKEQILAVRRYNSAEINRYTLTELIELIKNKINSKE